MNKTHGGTAGGTARSDALIAADGSWHNPNPRRV
jgi:hypothetical protein